MSALYVDQPGMCPLYAGLLVLGKCSVGLFCFVFFFLLRLLAKMEHHPFVNTFPICNILKIGFFFLIKRAPKVFSASFHLLPRREWAGTR